ncbi:MAG: acyl-CoA thioesterase [Microbacteriaceae bacterium]
MRVHVPIHLRWADLDAYNHVNNVAFLRILEEARVRAFWLPDAPTEDASEPGPGRAARGQDASEPGTADWDGVAGQAPPTAVLDASAGAATLTLIASHQIEYLLPLSYQRQPLDVQTWVGRIGGASADLCYEVVSGDRVYARAATTMVFVDALSQRPRRIAEPEREAWAPYIEAPIRFTTRTSRTAD